MPRRGLAPRVLITNNAPQSFFWRPWRWERRDAADAVLGIAPERLEPAIYMACVLLEGGGDELQRSRATLGGGGILLMLRIGGVLLVRRRGLAELEDIGANVGGHSLELLALCVDV